MIAELELEVARATDVFYFVTEYTSDFNARTNAMIYFSRGGGCGGSVHTAHRTLSLKISRKKSHLC